MNSQGLSRYITLVIFGSEAAWFEDEGKRQRFRRTILGGARVEAALLRQRFGPADPGFRGLGPEFGSEINEAALVPKFLFAGGAGPEMPNYLADGVKTHMGIFLVGHMGVIP